MHPALKVDGASRGTDAVTRAPESPDDLPIVKAHTYDGDKAKKGDSTVEPSGKIMSSPKGERIVSNPP